METELTGNPPRLIHHLYNEYRISIDWINLDQNIKHKCGLLEVFRRSLNEQEYMLHRFDLSFLYE